MASILKMVSRYVAHDRPLFWTGILGLVLGLVCFGGMTIHGVIVEPEGNLYKAATFDIAVGLFLLTLVLIERKAGFSPRGGAIWRWALIALTLFGYSVETIQIFRGFDPRFSTVAPPLDRAIGGLFFLSAIGIMICFLVLTLRFFFRPVDSLVLALRYGTLASLFGFGIGIAMSALGGPYVGGGGNLLPLHAAGFHGLQAVPLVALLLAWSGAGEDRTRLFVHVTGLAWLVACLGIAWQSFSGRSVLEPSVATAVTLVMLAVCGIAIARAILDVHRANAWPFLDAA